MGLPYREEIMIVGRWTVQSTSGQSTSVTDGWNRITMIKTVQRIASHGNNVYD